MSLKNVQKSRVSVNEVVSSDEDIDSDSNNDHINEEFDVSNNNNTSEDNDNGGDNESTTGANSGWADAISKVLSVKPKKKPLILSKAKKDKDLKQKSDEQTASLELVKSDGTVVPISQRSKKLKTDESVGKKKKKNKLSKNQWEVMHRLKPKEEDKERERQLCSIATKGVVQLFNAVREQQKTIETKIKEVGSSETKRDKMLTQFNKNQFLDKLKQMDKFKKDKSTTDSEPKDKQTWKVLRDDFMIGAKMKDWDKESDSDNESND